MRGFAIVANLQQLNYGVLCARRLAADAYNDALPLADRRALFAKAHAAIVEQRQEALLLVQAQFEKRPTPPPIDFANARAVDFTPSGARALIAGAS
jgi:hypothetical protein